MSKWIPAHDVPAEAIERLNQVMTNPTREDRLRLHYRAIAGEFPGPNKAAIAALLASRLVEIEDRKADE